MENHSHSKQFLLDRTHNNETITSIFTLEYYTTRGLLYVSL